MDFEEKTKESSVQKFHDTNTTSSSTVYFKHPSDSIGKESDGDGDDDDNNDDYVRFEPYHEKKPLANNLEELITVPNAPVTKLEAHVAKGEPTKIDFNPEVVYLWRFIALNNLDNDLSSCGCGDNSEDCNYDRHDLEYRQVAVPIVVVLASSSEDVDFCSLDTDSLDVRYDISWNHWCMDEYRCEKIGVTSSHKDEIICIQTRIVWAHRDDYI